MTPIVNTSWQLPAMLDLRDMIYAASKENDTSCVPFDEISTHAERIRANVDQLSEGPRAATVAALDATDALVADRLDVAQERMRDREIELSHALGGAIDCWTVAIDLTRAFGAGKKAVAVNSGALDGTPSRPAVGALPTKSDSHPSLVKPVAEVLLGSIILLAIPGSVLWALSVWWLHSWWGFVAVPLGAILVGVAVGMARPGRRGRVALISCIGVLAVLGVVFPTIRSSTTGGGGLPSNCSWQQPDNSQDHHADCWYTDTDGMPYAKTVNFPGVTHHIKTLTADRTGSIVRPPYLDRSP